MLFFMDIPKFAVPTAKFAPKPIAIAVGIPNTSATICFTSLMVMNIVDILSDIFNKIIYMYKIKNIIFYIHIIITDDP